MSFNLVVYKLTDDLKLEDAKDYFQLYPQTQNLDFTSGVSASKFRHNELYGTVLRFPGIPVDADIAHIVFDYESAAKLEEGKDTRNGAYTWWCEQLNNRQIDAKTQKITTTSDRIFLITDILHINKNLFKRLAVRGPGSNKKLKVV